MPAQAVFAIRNTPAPQRRFLGTSRSIRHRMERPRHEPGTTRRRMPMFARLSAALLLGSLALPAQAADQVEKAPPAGAYKKVSELAKLPDFLPGLGQLFVDPKTLPAGPFLAYDREGRLVSTVYMLPIEDLSNKDKRFDDLSAPGGTVDHVDVYFNAGHPGVEKPHAHVILWHVPKADETRVAAK